MKNYITAVIISLGIIISTTLLVNGFKNRNKNNDTISVTGLGSKDFTSDLIVWNSSFSKRSYDLKDAYASLENDRNAIKAYLQSKGVKENEIVFSSVNINKEFNTVYDENANVRSQTFAGYSLSQNVQVE